MNKTHTTNTGTTEWRELPAVVVRQSGLTEQVDLLRERLEEAANASDKERDAYMDQLIEAEYALPDDDLRNFVAARLRAWLALDRHSGTLVASAYRAALERQSASVALRRTAFDQSAVQELSLPEQDKLRRLDPVLFDDQAVPQLSEAGSAQFAHRTHATIGTSVLSSDGKTLGTVSKVAGKYFGIGADGHRYWLPVNVVRSADDEAVILDFDAEQIEQFKLDQIDSEDASGPLDETLEGQATAREQKARRQELIRGRDAAVEGTPDRGSQDEPTGGTDKVLADPQANAGIR